MKVMVIVKASKSSEAGVMPGEALLTAMGKYNEELVKAGICSPAKGFIPAQRGSAFSSRAASAAWSTGRSR
jgi:hypothetical protein